MIDTLEVGRLCYADHEMKHSIERLNLYATDREAKRAVEWARKRWRTWQNHDGTQPRSASTLLRDLLIRAMEADGKRKRR